MQVVDKRNISVVLSDPPCKDDNAWFTRQHFNLIVEDIVARFPVSKSVQLISPMPLSSNKCVIHICREPASENKETKR